MPYSKEDMTSEYQDSVLSIQKCQKVWLTVNDVYCQILMVIPCECACACDKPALNDRTVH